MLESYALYTENVRTSKESNYHPPIRAEICPQSHTTLKIREVKLGQSEIPVYLLENKFLFDRPGIYSDKNGNYPDNPLRCFILSKSALHLENVIGWSPDIFHCHDWMTGPFLPI